MDRDSETRVALLMYFHRVPVIDFRIGCYQKVAQGTECPTSHDLCLRDAMQIHLHGKS